MKDDEHEGKKGVSKGQSASRNMAKVGASCGGEGRKHTKMVMEGVGGATELVGEDWADSRNMAENQGSGDVDKGCRDSSSLILGG